MTRLNKLAGCLGALALTMLLATPARASLNVCILDSVNLACSGGPNTASTLLNSLVLNFADADFSINLNTATSNAPGASSATIHIDSIFQATDGLTGGTTSTCTWCGDRSFGGISGTYNLMILVSETAFTKPIGPGMLTQNVNTNTISTAPTTGLATFDGYEVNSGAPPFAWGVNVVGPATFPSFDNANNDTRSAGPYTTSLPFFTLTEILQLDVTNTNQGQATSNLSIGAVPEPASILLLGTVLLGLGSLLRKRVS